MLLTPPEVKLETDADLDIGVFGIATRFVRGARPPQDAGAPKSEPKPGATMVYKAVAPPEEPAPATNGEAEVVRETAVLKVDGARYELTKRRVVIGRSKDCDIKLEDPNVSRRHAEVQHEGEKTYWVVDLDSTNGVETKGKRVKKLKLEDGTRFTIGSTEIVFSWELA